MRGLLVARENQLLAAIVLIALLPLVFITFLGYKNTKDAAIDEYLDNLHAVNESRVANINHLVHLRMEQAVLLTTYIETLGKNAISDPKKIERLQAFLESSLSSLKDRNLLKNKNVIAESAVTRISVRNASGVIIASTERSLIGENFLVESAIQQFRDNNFRVLGYAGNYWKTPNQADPSLFFSVGLQDPDSENFIGLVTLRVNPDILNQVTSNRAGLRETGETYLVDRNNVMITTSRFMDNKQSPIKVDTVGIQKARNLEAIVYASYIDYRGVKVFGANHYFPDNQWVLLTEMDEAEVLAIANANFRKNLLVTGITAFFALIFSVRLARSINRSARKSQKNRRDAELIKKIAVIANVTNDPADAMRSILKVICLNCGWDLGHVFLLSKEDPGMLISSDIWFSKPEHNYQEFKEATNQTIFTKDVGLPGMALEQRKPCWISDVRNRQEFSRGKSPKDIKVRGAFAFPAIVENQVIGVFEFYSKQPEPIDTELLDVMAQVGIEVGNIVTRKEQELALLASRSALEVSNRLKQDFLTMISHELRTPMNAILGGIQVAQHYIKGQLSSPFDIIQRGANDIMIMINDILMYTEIQADMLSENRESVRLLEILDEMKLRYQHECNDKNLELRWNIDPKLPPWILLDMEKTRVLLAKLLDNAVIFTNQGYVDFSLRYLHDENGPCLKCVVADSGIGINKRDHKTVFKPFRQRDAGLQRQYGGLGVGLTICQELVQLLSGTIELESSLSTGTRITLSLPVEQGNAEDEKRIREKASADLPILIVEDNYINQRVTEKMLENLGYRSIVANQGAEGLEKLQENSFSLVLMDLQMPVMDGFTCTEKIRARKDSLKDIPIVAVTANLMDADKKRCINSGMNDYLPKPLSIDHLKKTLEQYLETPDVRQAS